MTIVLGIHDGTHDAGAAIVEDGVVLAACDEERFCRKKGAGGWPTLAIKACFESTGLSLNDVHSIAFAGFVNPNPVLRLLRKQQRTWRLDDGKFYDSKNSLGQKFSDWLQFNSPFPKLSNPNKQYTRLIHKMLQQQCKRRLQWSGPIEVHDHHRCHAASAYFQSGFDHSLVVVVDGLGDGLCSTIWEGKASSLKLLHKIEFPNSYGLLYSCFTGYLGFKPFRHEGKLTGLAAHGNPDNITQKFPFTGSFPNRKFTEKFPLYNWLSQFDNYQREDICAWLQTNLQQEITGLIQYFINQYRLPKLSLAGGVFANVRLNQSIVEHCTVEDLFVFPNMGDAGLSVGAALCSGNSMENWQPKRLTSAYLGPKNSESDIQKALNKTRVNYQKSNNLAATVAELLAAGKIVAVCNGKMEYGPRALGNRSILADPGIPSVVERLNQSLQRSDFMPFAPVFTNETIRSYVHWNECYSLPTQYMTITVAAKSSLREKCPAIVHIDGTLRPQVVTEHQHPLLWEVITLFEQKTQRPALINTSFNIHEEPIVSTPEEAIRAFSIAKLDALILGNYLITSS